MQVGWRVSGSQNEVTELEFLDLAAWCHGERVNDDDRFGPELFGDLVFVEEGEQLGALHVAEGVVVGTLYSYVRLTEIDGGSQPDSGRCCGFTDGRHWDFDPVCDTKNRLLVGRRRRNGRS